MRCKNCGWENPAHNTQCEKCKAPFTGSTGAEITSPSVKMDTRITAKGCPVCGYPIRKVEKTCPHCGHVFINENQAVTAGKEVFPQKERPTDSKHSSAQPAAPQPAAAQPAAVQPAAAQRTIAQQIVAQPVAAQRTIAQQLAAQQLAAQPAAVQRTIAQPPPPQPAAVKQTPLAPKPAQKICVFCKASVPETSQFCSNCGASLSNERKTLGTIKPWTDVEQIKAPGCSLTFITGNNEPADNASLHYTGHLIQLNRSNTDPSNQTITSKTQAELCFENDKWYIQDKSALKTTYIYAGYKIELKQDDIIVLGNRSFKFAYVPE